MRRRHARVSLVSGALIVAAAACGGEEATLTGYERTPPPVVADISLPDLEQPGAEVAFRAQPDELLLVYFGYLNCPDYCPTTLSDLRIARQQLDDEIDARIDVAMVTVDPDRDLENLPTYIGSFFDDGIALGTADPAALETAAAPFGVAYSITIDEETGEPLVGHTTSLYAVDDTGTLVLTWPFGAEPEQIATDIEILFDRIDSA